MQAKTTLNRNRNQIEYNDDGTHTQMNRIESNCIVNNKQTILVIAIHLLHSRWNEYAYLISTFTEQYRIKKYKWDSRKKYDLKNYSRKLLQTSWNQIQKELLSVVIELIDKFLMRNEVSSWYWKWYTIDATLTWIKL